MGMGAVWTAIILFLRESVHSLQTHTGKMWSHAMCFHAAMLLHCRILMVHVMCDRHLLHASSLDCSTCHVPCAISDFE